MLRDDFSGVLMLEGVLMSEERVSYDVMTVVSKCHYVPFCLTLFTCLRFQSEIADDTSHRNAIIDRGKARWDIKRALRGKCNASAASIVIRRDGLPETVSLPLPGF